MGEEEVGGAGGADEVTLRPRQGNPGLDWGDVHPEVRAGGSLGGRDSRQPAEGGPDADPERGEYGVLGTWRVRVLE